jgi:ferredoxin--NADP+ reductase
MARSGALHERFEQIVFVHGVRHENQLGYHDELMDLASSAPKFRYICALSGAAESQHNALRGRIPQTFADGSLEKAAGPFDAECHMLLCGNPDMIEATTELLKARGFEKHRRKKAGHFNFEKYW